MDTQNPRSRIGGSWTAQLLATRRGAMTVAALAALLAGVLLYLFVQHYKSNGTPSAAAPSTVNVFETTKYIPAGTPAQTLASEGLLQKTQVSSKQAQVGAIADPSAITGEVSATNIAKGQQVTAADFTHANVTIGAYLTGTQRAIAVPLDAPHGLTSYLAAGNTVDMMVDNGGTTSVLAQNLSILENTGGDVVLRVSDKQALQISAASDSTKIWLVLRPPTGAQQSIRVGSKGTY
jgi:Flp pilus assembly protein CpaB